VSGPPLVGRLLVASPALLDPNFHRTVVLLLDHGPGGALGLVLNRPTATDLDEPLPQWRDHAVAPAVVFVGGPVQPDAAIGLARSREAAVEGWRPLFDQLGTLDLAGEPAALTPAIDGLRVYAGYAGWAAGQLEGEIEAGAWWVVRSAPGDVLCDDPAQLWRTVLHRQGGAIGAVANYPAELSDN
jgi:putative transcriptional regulator